MVPSAAVVVFTTHLSTSEVISIYSGEETLLRQRHRLLTVST